MKTKEQMLLEKKKDSGERSYSNGMLKKGGRNLR